MSTEIHWFRRPGAIAPDHPGTLNPVYELLDHPIVLGRADEPFLESEHDAEGFFTHEVALDRVAKLAGILRLLGVGPDVPVRIAAEVPEPAAVLARLAVVRVGGRLVEDASAPVDVELVTGRSASVRDVHRAFDKPVRRLLSGFEGVAVAARGEDGVLAAPVDLDPVMRDARIEPAAAAELPADLVVIAREDGAQVPALAVAESPASVLTVPIAN
ncbi:hypothetical protein MTQ12_02890 [Brevibacterium sp. R8603A2]|uniref:hypothetical protein n=1 Tax=Brevibacterium sp. R8603A2 TaxID=2929779 RepID=UPI001FF97524|nr:hypothetical protein [Brevibacterium sp. R8603A2]MCK1802003.1 hypothetical protein [Brevibacterium sp. R8603A2]